VEGSGALGARRKIGDLARETGRTVRALRLYEELGLLRPDERTLGGFRVYGPDAVNRVRWIGKLQDLGFTLSSIGELCTAGAATSDGAVVMGPVRQVFEGKLTEVRAQMENLRALEQDLVKSLEYLEDCCSCHRGPMHLVCQSCSEPGHGAAQTPVLVGGIRQPRQ
jgi:DNA-binding transcriptional MerR regulator